MTTSTEDKNTNAQIAYEYAQYLYDKADEGISRINGRLTTTLGSSALLLKFSLDLNDSDLCLAITKIISSLTLTLSIGLCLQGLLPRVSGEGTQKPSKYFEKKWLNDDQQEIYINIARGLNHARNGILETYFDKANSLRGAYWSLFGTGILFVINIIADSI